MDESFRKLSLEDSERILEGKFHPQRQCFHPTSWVLRHQKCCLFYRSFCLLVCFSLLLRKLSFPTLPRSVAWCFGQRIGWQDLDWKSMGFDNSLSGSFSFLLFSITTTLAVFHSWQGVKLLFLFQESLLSAVSCVCIKCRYVGCYNMFQLALLWVVIPEELIHILRK